MRDTSHANGGFVQIHTLWVFRLCRRTWRGPLPHFCFLAPLCVCTPSPLPGTSSLTHMPSVPAGTGAVRHNQEQCRPSRCYSPPTSPRKKPPRRAPATEATRTSKILDWLLWVRMNLDVTSNHWDCRVLVLLRTHIRISLPISTQDKLKKINEDTAPTKQGLSEQPQQCP